jgi:serine/threonine protein kinase
LANEEFELMKKLGEGGFAVVYMLKDSHGLETALKVLQLYKVTPKDYPLYKKRVMGEFKVGKLKHRNLVHYKSLGMLYGNPYMLMEYCPGGNDWIEKAGEKRPMAEGRILRLLNQVAQGMAHLHNNNIVHRDIKPENILMGRDHDYKLADFGIAAQLDHRMTEVGMWGKVKNGEIFGSPLYSPLEQLNDRTYFQATDKKMDIYSFGMLAHSLLYPVEDPFGGSQLYQSNQENYFKNKRNYNPRDREIPEGYSPQWKDFLYNCMHREPGKRIPTAKEVQVVLAEIMGPIHPLVLDELFNGLEGDVLVGRNTENYAINQLDLGKYTPKDYSISKHHATLKKLGEDYFIKDGQEVVREGAVVDIYALNGVYLNGERIGVDKLYKIEKGDVLRIGGINLWVG